MDKHLQMTEKSELKIFKETIQTSSALFFQLGREDLESIFKKQMLLSYLIPTGILK